MKCDHLLAKSLRRDGMLHESMFLRGHLADVHNSAREVLDTTARDQLEALGLPVEQYLDRFRRIVLLAAALHDLGKANDHCQGMLTWERNVKLHPQGLRHEWVTVLMLKSLRQWLLPAVNGSEIDFAIVEWVVAGHHPSHTHASPPTLCPPGAGTTLESQMGHKDFAGILTWIAMAFGLRGLSTTPTGTTSSYPLIGFKNAFVELANWSKMARRLWDEKIRRSDDRMLAAAAKGCLIAADIAGSALPKAMPDDRFRWSWIGDSFSKKPEPGDFPKVVEHRLDGDLPREFQKSVANSNQPVTLVKAGCGTGKTLAAYMWAARNHPTRRLYFCYPTTGTATEGFKDYLFEPEGELGNLGAKLFHSRRDIDFEIILGTGPDSESPDADAVAKLESLEAWSTPVVACTVDTVLGLVQNNKRGLFAWPALAQSAFVFDEIHSYDDRLFGALLRFLRDLPGLPALLMTASLPQARQDALGEVLKKHRQIDLKPIEGPKDLEQLPRYYKTTIKDNDPLAAIEQELNGGGKVLWVCNTVGRVMDAATRAGAKDLKPLLYHSRFKYVDRVQRHKAVVEAFTPERMDSVLAICSQVAEMSLDLKGCTMLVTDEAPVPAMIQRLGRLNRQAKDGDQTRPFIVIEPDNHLPYSPADLDAARTWLAKLPEKNIRQHDLAEMWEQTVDHPPELVASAWLDGGPTTTVSELREASPGITVVMREDIIRIEKPKDLGKYTLPMPPPPKRLDWHSWPKRQGIPIAEAGIISYDELRGAKWQ